MKRTRDEHTGGYGLCTKCNTWVKNRTAFYKLHHNSKCIRNVDTVEAANPPYSLGNNETEVYDDEQSDAGSDNGEHDGLPIDYEDDAAYTNMNVGQETSLFDEQTTVEEGDPAHVDVDDEIPASWAGAQAQYESDGEVVSCVETEVDMDIYGEADEEVLEADEAYADTLASNGNSSRDEFLFPKKLDCDYTVKEVALFELREKMTMKLTDADFNTKLRSTKFYLDSIEPNNNYPASEHACKKILGIEDVWESAVHYCPECFTRYPKLEKREWLRKKQDVCGTPGCTELRFECRKTTAGEVVYPKAYFIYFGVKKAILASYATGQLAALRAQPNARTRDDIWNGKLVKRLNEEHLGGELLHEEDVTAVDGSRAKLRKCGLLDVGFDGAKLWTHKQYSMDFFVMRYWDVPFEVRGKTAFTMLLGLYPQSVKQGKMQDIFMAPFVEEMQKLGSEGVSVYDPFLKQSYVSKWFLGTVSADTPARNVVGKFYGVSGYRADYRSLFQGAKFSNINSDGTYFTGYCAPVKQFMFFDDDEELWANDPRLILNHTKSLDLASRVQNGKVIDGVLLKMPANVAGRHGLPPLAELTYFDLHFGYLLPWIHAGPWGILKNFWKHLLRDYIGRDAPPLCIPNRVRKIISQRAKYLVLTSDMGRPYTDIVRYKGTWVMENWLHWAETFSPVIAHDVLQENCPEAFDAWLHLRRAFLHYLCSHDWYDHLDAGEKDKARVDAKVSMRTYAEFVESKLGIEYCTINLRLLTVHSYEQEIQTGPIKHTLEFWVERAIQRYKKWVKDRVVLKPDIFLGNCYLLECALNVASVERDVHELISRAQQAVQRDTLDDDKLYMHLVGSGKRVEVNEAFVGDKLDLLREFLDDSRRLDIESAFELAGEVSVHVFKRAQVDLEVFHSTEYLRTTSRCSYHVCYQLKGDDASTKRFGRVLRYYKMQEGLGQTTFRICEMDEFEGTPTEDDKMLGYDTVSTASPVTRFVALEDFRRKVILFEPPDCKERNEARVLQCWTKGRI